MKEPKNWKRLFIFLLMVLLTCLLFAAASADSTQYIVSSNSSPVNVRGAASRDSSVVAKLKTGTQVTVIGEDGLLCDALSTALFVMGLERAEEYRRTNGGFEMILVSSEGRIFLTEGIADRFENVSEMPAEVINERK